MLTLYRCCGKQVMQKWKKKNNAHFKQSFSIHSIYFDGCRLWHRKSRQTFDDQNDDTIIFNQRLGNRVDFLLFFFVLFCWNARTYISSCMQIRVKKCMRKWLKNLNFTNGTQWKWWWVIYANLDMNFYPEKKTVTFVLSFDSFRAWHLFGWRSRTNG